MCKGIVNANEVPILQFDVTKLPGLSRVWQLKINIDRPKYFGLSTAVKTLLDLYTNSPNEAVSSFKYLGVIQI